MLKIYPHSAVAWIIKSLSMQQKGEIPEALEAAKTAIRMTPENADAHFVLGSILMRSEQTDAAITEYDNALRFSEQPRKFAIYSQARMLDILENTRIAPGENVRIKPALEKKMLGLTGVLERITDEASED
jgi:tetratricopeptide (TPR) repeat protein